MSDPYRVIEDFVGRRKWAVVGVSRDSQKYGNIIFRDLRAAGYDVMGVHPEGHEVDGVQTYPTLADLPERPDVVDLVVPPEVSEQIVREAHALGLNRIWMQPGAASAAAVRYAREHGMEVVSGGPCAMVHKRRWADADVE